MVAIIGVTMNFDYKNYKYTLRDEYMEAILKVGGIPVAFPYTEKKDDLMTLLSLVDGLLITGGMDIDPSYYNQAPLPQIKTMTPNRDRFEIPLIKEALKTELPILGICRGMHSLNVAAGGTLYQDIETQIPKSIQHSQSTPRQFTIHEVAIIKESQLQRSMGGVAKLRVNSFHHQAIHKLGDDFQAAAEAPDGIIEAIENPSFPFAMGVQWHPAALIEKEPHAYHLLHAFIEAATRQ